MCRSTHKMKLQEKEKDMGNNTEGQVKSKFPVSAGDEVCVKGIPFKILDTHVEYHRTSDYQSSLYVYMQSMAAPIGATRIMTHNQLLREMDSAPVERFVTPAQIITADPCVEGLIALGQALGYFHRSYNSENKAGAVYLLTTHLIKEGTSSKSISVNELYWNYNDKTRSNPPTDWMLFLAKMLDLVPKSSSGPDRPTLKRLLGIKETR